MTIRCRVNARLDAVERVPHGNRTLAEGQERLIVLRVTGAHGIARGEFQLLQWSSQDLVDSKSAPKEKLIHVHEAAQAGSVPVLIHRGASTRTACRSGVVCSASRRAATTHGLHSQFRPRARERPTASLDPRVVHGKPRHLRSAVGSSWISARPAKPVASIASRG
jgi:hypothetical protein